MRFANSLIQIYRKALIGGKLRQRTILLTALLLLILTIPGYSTIRYVKAGNQTPSYPYTSWETASDSIQKVVDICLSGDTIMIGNGVYRELIRSERNNITLSFIGTDVDSCIFDLSGYPPEDTVCISIFVSHSITLENLNFTTTPQMNDHYAMFLFFSPSRRV